MGGKKGCYGCNMMGVRRAIGSNKGAVLILHSPKACGQVVREKDTNSISNYIAKAEDYIPILTTDIRDEDAIFGAQQKLENCLKYALERYKPSYIFVANSCVSGIIGDDVIGICEVFSEEHGIPVYPIEYAGFMNGGYEAGLYKASIYLMDNYMKPLPKKADQIILTGIVDKQRSYEYKFVREILQQWGLEITCLFPGSATIEEMAQLPAARNVLLCSKFAKVADPFLKIAQELERRFDMPVINLQDPVGYSSSLNWIKQLGEALQLPPEEIVRVHDKLQHDYQELFEEYKAYGLKGKAVVYVAKLPFLFDCLSWLLELVALLDIEVEGICFAEDIPQELRQQFMELENTQLPQLPLTSLERTDYIFSLWQENAVDMEYVPIPFINRIFGVPAIRSYCEQILRMAMKRRHRGEDGE